MVQLRRTDLQLYLQLEYGLEITLTIPAATPVKAVFGVSWDQNLCQSVNDHLTLARAGGSWAW